MIRKLLVGGVTTGALVVGMAVPALAAHESTNVFNLRSLTTAGADGSGYSIYNPEKDTWDSRVTVSRLRPGAPYTFFAEGKLTDGRYVKTPICVLLTDSSGNGSCAAIGHEEPALAYANVRAGSGNKMGNVVLTAKGSVDADTIVEDGEIERFPTG